MNEERVFSFRNIWFTASVGAVLGIAAIGALIGLVWVPSVQGDKNTGSLWDDICSAAGVASPWQPAQQPLSPVKRPSDVIVSSQMMASADSQSIGRGGTLAQQCTMCHGARGKSMADSPNLAGQYAAAIYKQLRDFKSGYRKNAIMAPMAQNLSDQNMRDLAAYYASLPKEPNPAAGSVPLPVIVSNGAPMRNIPPCASCHGGIDNKTASPWLDGEPEVYIRTQLEALASGARRNDIHEQMRNIARQMTREEIAAAARYYASR